MKQEESESSDDGGYYAHHSATNLRFRPPSLFTDDALESSSSREALTSPLLTSDHEHFEEDHFVDECHLPPTTINIGSDEGGPPLHHHHYHDSPSIRRRPSFQHHQQQPQQPHPHPPTTRILDRDGRFGQSRGKWHVQRISRGVRPGRASRWTIFTVFDDWFHSLAYKPTFVLMTILFLAYTATIFIFSWFYLLVSKFGSRRQTPSAAAAAAAETAGAETLESMDSSLSSSSSSSTSTSSFCGMDITNHMEALYFSLSTMTTIGYGVSDYYFGDCWTPFILVLMQVLAAITFDAIAIGLLFQRMSRSQKRVKTIIFSEKAVVRRVRGVPHFMFRVGELRRHHIIEAHVRVYCVRHERYPVMELNCNDYVETTTVEGREGEEEGMISTASREIETTHFVTRPMKLCNTNNDLGSYILMSLPQVMVHKMDASSPIMPPRPIWYDVTGVGHSIPPHLEIDNLETETSVSAIKRNLYDQQVDGIDHLHSARGAVGATEEDVLFGNDEESLAHERKLHHFALEDDDIHRFLIDRETELIVLVEGTDELTGLALQARHSYRWDDIVFNKTFAPCIFPCTREEGDDASGFFRQRDCGRLAGPSMCSVDYIKFHDLVDAPKDCFSCPFVPDNAE